jgi:uncharacterized protein
MNRAERCAMTNYAQQELPRRTDILRAVSEANDLTLGVHARVRMSGRARVGDDAFLLA